jgi:hypothetical protein
MFVQVGKLYTDVQIYSRRFSYYTFHFLFVKAIQSSLRSVFTNKKVEQLL